MNNILLNSDMTIESFQNFMDEVNTSLRVGGDIYLYICSDGGKASTVPMFRSIIERHGINLIACSELASAAVELFLTSNVQRTVLDNTTAMVHKPYFKGVAFNKDVQPLRSADKLWLNLFKEPIKASELVKTFIDFTEEEQQVFDNDGDVYLNEERLKKALKKSEKYFAEKK
ncbi:MAG: hypothetical protein PQJ49_12450 [Sphaerochaetaceae bacterium]|nr:hypothetical protein [Sphaerochaetaceae bacterium]